MTENARNIQESRQQEGKHINVNIYSNDLLEKILTENFYHARHQENQRERNIIWYWAIWSAILAYIGRDGAFIDKIDDNYYIFLLLAIISFASLLSTLKWSAEFANHISAIALISEKLGLNKLSNEGVLSNNSPLPFQ